CYNQLVLKALRQKQLSAVCYANWFAMRPTRACITNQAMEHVLLCIPMRACITNHGDVTYVLLCIATRACITNHATRHTPPCWRIKLKRLLHGGTHLLQSCPGDLQRVLFPVLPIKQLERQVAAKPNQPQL